MILDTRTKMATFETFSYTPVELAAQLTVQTQNTMVWLLNNGYLTEEAYTELIDSLVVTPIQNKNFGYKLLKRFFNSTKDENSWVFPITQIDESSRNNTESDPKNKKGKPNLEVVK